MLASLKGLFSDLNLKKNWDCTVLTLYSQSAFDTGTPNGVTQIIVVFVFNGLINLLILSVFANLRFIQADCTDIISTSPKAVRGERDVVTYFNTLQESGRIKALPIYKIRQMLGRDPKFYQISIH